MMSRRTNGTSTNRVYAIWPASREGEIATSPDAWHQDRHWVVLDITDGIKSAHVVEGPIRRATARRRELELRAIAEDVRPNPRGLRSTRPLALAARAARAHIAHTDSAAPENRQ